MFWSTELTKQVFPKFFKPFTPGILDKVGSNVRLPRWRCDDLDDLVAEEAEEEVVVEVEPTAAARLRDVAVVVLLVRIFEGV